jgi:hypothetical protein
MKPSHKAWLGLRGNCEAIKGLKNIMAFVRLVFLVQFFEQTEEGHQ